MSLELPGEMLRLRGVIHYDHGVAPGLSGVGEYRKQVEPRAAAYSVHDFGDGRSLRPEAPDMDRAAPGPFDESGISMQDGGGRSGDTEIRIDDEVSPVTGLYVVYPAESPVPQTMGVIHELPEPRLYIGLYSWLVSMDDIAHVFS